MQSTWR